MATTVKDFVGTWNVQWVTGKNPWFQVGWALWLGTDSNLGDKKPFLDGEYQTCIGFAVVDGNGQVVLSSADQDEHQQPLALLYDGGTLRWAGYYGGQPLRFYVSLSAAQGPTGDTTFVSLYGSTIYGDPDQVAVWGADGVGN